MVALSDSRVTIASSTLMVSPLSRTDVDDRDISEIADVRNLHFNDWLMSVPRAQTDIGFGLLTSILYFDQIASATFERSIAPSSASAFSAASVTQWRSTSKKWRSFSRNVRTAETVGAQRHIATIDEGRIWSANRRM